MLSDTALTDSSAGSPFRVSTDVRKRRIPRSALSSNPYAHCIVFCPKGKIPLTILGKKLDNMSYGQNKASSGNPLKRACPQKAECTSGQYKYLAIHIHESARQRARELVNTPAFARAQRQRKKVEALFAELKNQIGLRRLRLRRMKFVREQFFLAAVAQNIKRLVRFLSQPTEPPTVTT